MKKAISILITLVLLMSLAVPAFAVDTDGKITITGASKGNTYSIYKILDLSFLDATGTEPAKYSYVAKAPWLEFFQAQTAYVTLDSGNHVSWVAGADVAAFAKKALEFAKEKNIKPETGHTIAATTDGQPLVFENLELGYYLIDSTMGALCGLTTTDRQVEVSAKNGVPTLDKNVQEDFYVENSASNTWFDQNTADIGQRVDFEVSINVHPGAENYIFHDKMSEGLTYGGIIPGDLKHLDHSEGTTVTIPDSYYVVKSGVDCADGCTFHIEFTKAFCDHLAVNDKILIRYWATLNEKAIVGGAGNTNEAYLSFGENSNHTTTPSVTVTYTYGFDLLKINGQRNLLDGAIFQLYNKASGGDPIKLIKIEDYAIPGGGTCPQYRLAKPDEAGAVDTFEVDGGRIRIVGFDNGEYFLQETVAPDGYNMLLSRESFTITDGNLDATLGADGKPATGTGVQIMNLSGNVLPGTGAMGTLLFTALGGAVVTGSGVLLVTKKRVSKYEDD